MVRVTRVQHDSDYRDTWEIQVRRHHWVGNPPTATDLPPDVRLALKEWLGGANKEND